MREHVNTSTVTDSPPFRKKSIIDYITSQFNEKPIAKTPINNIPLLAIDKLKTITVQKKEGQSPT